MKISDAKPGDTVIVKEGPAKGRVLRVVAKGDTTVAVSGLTKGSSVVRGDLEVE